MDVTIWHDRRLQRLCFADQRDSRMPRFATEWLVLLYHVSIALVIPSKEVLPSFSFDQ